MELSGIPKYIQLKEHIKALIISSKLMPGEKIHSENELANQFKISRHTVRQSISQLINEGFLYSLQGKGTFVARVPGLKKENSKIIGVITTYLNDYIFPDIIKGIDGVLSRKDYSIILGNTRNETQNERECLLKLFDKNIDGIIVEPTKSALPNPNLDIYREISSKGVPIVFIHGYYKDLNYSYVVEDDEAGGYLAVNQLIKLGHEKILGIFKVDDIQGHKRYNGYVQALREARIDIKDSRILWYTTEEHETLTENERFTNTLLSQLRECTAIVCYNDQIAIKIMDLLRKNSIKIPEDVSLISFDDSDICQVTEVKISSVAHPKEELGKKAAEAILALIEGQKIHTEEVMIPKMIIRHSTQKKRTFVN